MATLTGQTVASTYDLLLKVNTGGIDGTLRTIQDGLAANSALDLSTGAVRSTGTLTVDGVSTLTGAVTVAGALAANGGITCDTNKFIVADTTGNTTIAGTLDVTGVSTLTGATTVTGALAANGGITCDTDKFTVADTTGNTTVAGTLGVTGVITATGGVAGDVTGDVAGDVTGNITGDVKADDSALIITSGADLAASSIGDGVTATTQSSADNSTKVATTAYVDSANKVLQVVSGTLLTQATITGTSWAATGVTADITPASTSNKVLVTVTVYAYCNDAAMLALYRDSTKVGAGTDGSSDDNEGYAMVRFSNANQGGTFSYSFLDSPSSTSSITYTVQGRPTSSSDNLYINRRGDDGNYSLASTITLMEIAG